MGMNMNESRSGELKGLAAGPAALMSACLQPWSMLQDWNAFWARQWQVWFDTVVSAPNPWLPALAAARSDQPAAIDFFLPWLPRIQALVTPLDPAGEKDAVRVMLRASMPHVGLGDQKEWLDVDATVSRSPRAARGLPVEPASQTLSADDSQTAGSAQPLIEAQAAAADAMPDASEGAAKALEAKADAPKPRARKPAQRKTKTTPPSSAA